jgi:predicted ester cyclase
VTPETTHGKRVEVPGSVIYRIADGKIVEFRGPLDMMSLLQQIGAIPAPEQAEEASLT